MLCFEAQIWDSFFSGRGSINGGNTNIVAHLKLDCRPHFVWVFVFFISLPMRYSAPIEACWSSHTVLFLSAFVSCFVHFKSFYLHTFSLCFFFSCSAQIHCCSVNFSELVLDFMFRSSCCWLEASAHLAPWHVSRCIMMMMKVLLSLTHHELFYIKIEWGPISLSSSSSKHSANIRYNHIAHFNRHATKCSKWAWTFSFTFGSFFIFGGGSLFVERCVCVCARFFSSFHFVFGLFLGSSFCIQLNFAIFTTPFVFDKKKCICLFSQRRFCQSFFFSRSHYINVSLLLLHAKRFPSRVNTLAHSDGS